MDCKVIDVVQGSDEWLALRRCRITASNLRLVMAKPSTKSYREYQRVKVQELLGFEPEEGRPEWAEHGKELEPRAMQLYQLEYDTSIEHDVFLIHNEYDWLGASPDLLHLPEFDEGGEIKCRALYKAYRDAIARARKYEIIDPTKCCLMPDRFQVQGNMWLTGFDEWYYINYYEGTDLHGAPKREIDRVSVLRDLELIDAMELRCLAFMRECYELAGME